MYYCGQEFLRRNGAALIVNKSPKCSSVHFISFQLLSRVQLFATSWIAARQASLSITNSQSLPKLMSIKSVMSSSHLILCHPLLLLPPTPPSIRVFSNESTLRMRCPKYWSFSFSISPSSEHPGLVSFRMDLLDLLAVQGTLKSLLQHHSSKASILRCSTFFRVQLSHPHMTITRVQFQKWQNDLSVFKVNHSTSHNPSLCPNQCCWRAWGWLVLWRLNTF